MEKETILANIQFRLEIRRPESDIDDDFKQKRSDSSFRENEIQFFRQYQNEWNKIALESSEGLIKEYFSGIGLTDENLPKLQIYESYPGSWTINSALIMAGQAALVYQTLKSVSEIPKIVDGLYKLKDMIYKRFQKQVNDKTKNNFANSNYSIVTSVSIDPRPLMALGSSDFQSHKIHLNVAISKTSFVLENLDDTSMRNIIIGIFSSETQRHHWDLGDSYRKKIDVLSPHQTITINIDDFTDNFSKRLDLTKNLPLFVECWIQDLFGIYLFMFYLKE